MLSAYEPVLTPESKGIPSMEAVGRLRIVLAPRGVVVPWPDSEGPGLDKLRLRALREAFLLSPRIFPII